MTPVLNLDVMIETSGVPGTDGIILRVLQDREI
jgi:hypothetical protein